MRRIFVYEGREFQDTAPEQTVDQVRQRMADFYPELNNASVDTQKRNIKGEDVEVTTFTRRTGTKG